MNLPILTETLPVWRTVLRQNFTNLSSLVEYLEMSQDQAEAIDFNPQFSLNLPQRLAEKIAKNSLTDPLFLQFVPIKKERILNPEFKDDPVADATFQLSDKLLKKYEGRALIIATSACAMHCRFCFRKNFDYQTQDKTFAAELEILRNTPEIEEVLLSGGDPLSLSDDVLGKLLEKLEEIPHVKRIRFHTRFVMGIPERVDTSFLSLLANCTKQIWFVNHANHVNEFDDDIWNALNSIQKLGIPVINQTVLLNGVNGTHKDLHDLFSALVDHGIMPYYLHQLDEVQGSSHFKVEEVDGHALISSLMASLPGYGVPKYVREIPGKLSKTIL